MIHQSVSFKTQPDWPAGCEILRLNRVMGSQGRTYCLNELSHVAVVITSRSHDRRHIQCVLKKQQSVYVFMYSKGSVVNLQHECLQAEVEVEQLRTESTQPTKE